MKFFGEVKGNLKNNTTKTIQLQTLLVHVGVLDSSISIKTDRTLNTFKKKQLEQIILDQYYYERRAQLPKKRRGKIQSCFRNVTVLYKHELFIRYSACPMYL